MVLFVLVSGAEAYFVWGWEKFGLDVYAKHRRPFVMVEISSTRAASDRKNPLLRVGGAATARSGREPPRLAVRAASRLLEP